MHILLVMLNVLLVLTDILLAMSIPLVMLNSSLIVHIPLTIYIPLTIHIPLTMDVPLSLVLNIRLCILGNRLFILGSRLSRTVDLPFLLCHLQNLVHLFPKIQRSLFVIKINMSKRCVYDSFVIDLMDRFELVISQVFEMTLDIIFA